MRAMAPFELPLGLLTDFATLMLYATFIFFGVYSFVITYHWVKYAPSRETQLTTLGAYYAGSALLLIGMLGAYVAL